MGKKLKDLKKGDHIWFVENYYKHYEGVTTTPPKIYEGVIDEDTSPQRGLCYPDFCMVHYYCPELNPNHLHTSEFGEDEQGSNGHLFFTDHDECLEYVKDISEKKLSHAIANSVILNNEIQELKTILGL